MGRACARCARQRGRRTSCGGGGCGPPRRCPVTTPADVEAVTAANQELYEAFEVADLDRMEAIWDDADDVRCIHPGWPVLVGRARVMRSWSVLMANTNYIQFFLTGVSADVDGDVAVVTCEENILTGIDEPDGGLGGSPQV